MKKLAIVTTHPIQYYAPVFKLIQQRNSINIKVFYTWGMAAMNKHDPGFDKKVVWDIPLLEGYDCEWVRNTAPAPGSHHFNGIINSDLISNIKNYHPDAVLVFGWAYKSHLKVLRYFYGKLPVYFRGDSTLLDDIPSIRSMLKSLFLKWVYRHVDHSFYVGANNKAYFKKYGLKDNQLSFAPHAIDNNRFSEKRPGESMLLRRNLNIKDEECLILFTGKFEEKKDPFILLEVFSRLHARGVHLLFAGGGLLEANLKKAAASLLNVHFLSFQNQSNMPVIYQACDLFCMPSKGPGETWGLAVNEAMACGKAVLVSDKAGCAVDLVAIGVNGHIFRAGDVYDLTEKLKLLISDKGRLAEYGGRSEVMISDWCFENIAVAIENQLLNEKN